MDQVFQTSGDFSSACNGTDTLANCNKVEYDKI